jgi:hypothetical protein
MRTSCARSRKSSEDRGVGVVGKIVLLSSLDSGDVASISATLRAVADVESVADISGLKVAERNPDLIVAAAPEVHRAHVSLLGELRRAGPPPIPLLWVVGPGPGNLMRVAPDEPEGVVHIDASEWSIRRAALGLLGSRNPRAEPIELLSDADHLRSSLRQAVHLALVRTPPFAETRTVARSVGRTSSAITKSWKAADPETLPFKRFLMLIRLAHLQECLRMELTPGEAAAHCRIPRRTAERLCRTVLDTSFARLGSMEETLWARVADRVKVISERAS